MRERTTQGTAFSIAGPEGGVPLVLIHGLGLNRHVWRWHEPLLSRRYRVVSYDLYGHGESALLAETVSLSLFAEQLGDLLDDLGISTCAIIGFSLGGMINRRFAIDHPERVRALAILNSPHERSPEAQRLVEERAAATAQGGPAATLDATLERWFTVSFRKSPSRYSQRSSTVGAGQRSRQLCAMPAGAGAWCP